MMLGQAREKFAQIAGPQGGSSLNGAAMKAEAQTDLERLTKELETLVSGGSGYSFIIG
jgi:GTPase involved in cell partitioning and DNA repair